MAHKLPMACCTLLVAALLTASTAPAHADEGELKLSAAITSTVTTTTISDDLAPTRLALGAQFAAIYAITDFWQIGGSLRAGAGFLGDPAAELVAGAILDGRFVIDALTWVPWFTFGFGILIRSDGPAVYEDPENGAGPRLDATAHVGLGVDYRPERDWSIGAVFRYHFVLTDFARTVGPIEITLMGTFYLD